MGNEAAGIPVVSGPDVPDVFADECIAFERINDTVRMTFTSVKMAEPAPPSNLQHVVIGRLILPIGTAQRLALGLYDYLKNNGMDPTAALGAPDAPSN